jgi:hypothetical protein
VRTVAEIDLSILQKLRRRDIGRLRGEDRPLGALVDPELDERLIVMKNSDNPKESTP